MVHPISGRPCEFRIGSLNVNPGELRLWTSLRIGLNTIKKIMGDIVSPWKTPRVIGNGEVDQLFF